MVACYIFSIVTCDLPSVFFFCFFPEIRSFLGTSIRAATPFLTGSWSPTRVTYPTSDAFLFFLSLRPPAFYFPVPVPVPFPFLDPIGWHCTQVIFYLTHFVVDPLAAADPAAPCFPDTFAYSTAFTSRVRFLWSPNSPFLGEIVFPSSFSIAILPQEV